LLILSVSPNNILFSFRKYMEKIPVGAITVVMTSWTMRKIFREK